MPTKTKRIQQRILFLIVGTALVCVIQIILRYYVRDRFLLIPGLLTYAPVVNTGISFSLFRYVSPNILAVMELSVNVVLFVWLILSKHTLTVWTLGFFVVGGVSNVVDRLLYGNVFDYVYVHISSYGLFVSNLPDIMISIGFVLVCVDIGIDIFKPKKIT